MQWFPQWETKQLHEKDHHELRRSSALLGLGLSLVSAQVAHAGTWIVDPTDAGAPISSVKTDSGRTLSGISLPPGISIYGYKYDPALPNQDPTKEQGYADLSTIAPRTQTTVFIWKWIPDGRLDFDPTPKRDVRLSYVFTGGPLRGIVSGTARVIESAQLVAQSAGGLNFGVWAPSIDTVSTDARTSGPQYPPAGTRSVLVDGSSSPQGLDGWFRYATAMDANNLPYGVLTFYNVNSAKSNATLIVLKGGVAQSYFNQVGIRTTGATLIDPTAIFLGPHTK